MVATPKKKQKKKIPKKLKLTHSLTAGTSASSKGRAS